MVRKTKEEIVVYNNDMSNLPLRNMTAKEKDVFFAICKECKDKGSNEVCIDFSRLRKLTSFENQAKDKFVETLDKVNKNIMSVSFKWETDEEIRRTSLFNEVVIHKADEYVSATVNKQFLYILNDIQSNFTDFQLSDYVGFNSGYAKECFRQLRRYKDTGYFRISVEKLRLLLDVPESYENKDFMRRVLTPIEKELGEYYAPYGEFCIERVCCSGRGRQLKELIFRFPKLKDIQRVRRDSAGVYEYVPEGMQIEDPEAENAPQKENLCPDCKKPMSLIKSAQGELFWGHRNFKDGCNKTLEKNYFEQAELKSVKRAAALEESKRIEEIIRANKKKELKNSKSSKSAANLTKGDSDEKCLAYEKARDEYLESIGKSQLSELDDAEFEKILDIKNGIYAEEVM